MLNLDAISLHARRADTPILDNVSLAVATGSTTTLLGPSGAGKSSLLRVVMGLDTPSTGTVRHGNRLLTEAQTLLVPPAQRGFGYLFQDFTLFPHLDVRRNILIGIHTLDRAAKQARLDELAGMLGIGALLDRDIHDLSGGEQQRVALARTLAPAPEVLLLDEPFSNLDSHAKTTLWHDVREILRQQGITALIATHDQQEAFFFSERIAVLRGGRLLVEDTPQALYETPRTPWLARFTGKANCLTGLQTNILFAHAATLDPEATYLVRPEHIAIEAVDEEATPNPPPRIVDIEYYGLYSMLRVETTDGLKLDIMQTGAADCAIGQAARLRLNRHPVKLSTS